MPKHTPANALMKQGKKIFDYVLDEKQIDRKLPVAQMMVDKGSFERAEASMMPTKRGYEVHQVEN